MIKKCPRCNTEVDMSCSICPVCSFNFFEERPTLIHNYGPSSATAYTSSFNAIAEEFKDNLEAKKNRDELASKDNLNEKILSSYVKWGYLNYYGGEYSLSPLGKETYYLNQDYKKKKKKKPAENNR